MYKGQFAKWKWTKYNKPNNTNSLKPSRPRIGKRKAASTALFSTASKVAKVAHSELQLTTHSHLETRSPLHFNDDQNHIESSLRAYATLIASWAMHEESWLMTYDIQPSCCIQRFEPDHPSILQTLRSAQNHFLSGRIQQGGILLRKAFLGIEHAISRPGSGPAGSGLDLEALWDCCLAIPQLILTTGWTDLLHIFTSYLAQLTAVKLPSGHPISKIAFSLHRLARSHTPSACTSPRQLLRLCSPTPPHSPCTSHPPSPLEQYLTSAWHIWLNTFSSIRGSHDSLTIHLRRGFVTVLDTGPTHPTARTLLADFSQGVARSLATRGEMATTARILQLETLLVRMYVPLFTAETAARTGQMLRGIEAKVVERNKGVGVEGWEYWDRYMLFSARFFLGAIAASQGESEEIVRGWRRKSLGYEHDGVEEQRGISNGLALEGRDLFWAQTSMLVEQRFRAEGNVKEAEAIVAERIKSEALVGGWRARYEPVSVVGAARVMEVDGN